MAIGLFDVVDSYVFQKTVKRSVLQKNVNYLKSENCRHFASKCLELYQFTSGQKLFVPSKTVDRVDAEAPLKVEEISFYNYDCGLFEEFADALAER